MIDEDRTIQLFGYTSDELTKGSHKKVVAVCEECGTYRTTEHRVALKSVSGNLCSVCTTKNASAAPRPFAPDYTMQSVDESETFKRFGYHAYGLPATSGKYVVAVCTKCGRKRDIRKALYRDICRHCTAKSDHNRIRQSSAMQGIPYDEWESFAKDHPYCPKFNERCKESNREKYDRRCFLSGMTEEENGKKLSVHHIDMDKTQGCDGHTWKLVPLAMKLHSISHTPTWMARIQYLLNHVWSGA